MMQRANTLRVGAFFVAGVAVLATAVVLLSGGFFARSERALLLFEGSVYGLQQGAPVVLNGVRVGRVLDIGLRANPGGALRIPVQVELLSERLGSPGAEAALPGLLQRGLQGQLATQSLLTGLLYVDLKLRPPDALSARAQTVAVVDAASGLPVIPTSPAPVQALLTQLQTLDVAALIDDVSTIASSTRSLLSGPELKQGMQDLAALAADLRRLSAQLERRIDPLADDTQRSLAALRQTLDQLGRAAAQVQDTTVRAGSRVDSLADSATPALANAARAADELAQSAQALRRATADDSQLMQNLDRSTEEVARAARALRQLAEMLERDPQAVIRGRGEGP
jgi:paraquat-inducible protein B